MVEHDRVVSYYPLSNSQAMWFVEDGAEANIDHKLLGTLHTVKCFWSEVSERVHGGSPNDASTRSNHTVFTDFNHLGKHTNAGRIQPPPRCFMASIQRNLLFVSLINRKVNMGTCTTMTWWHLKSDHRQMSLSSILICLKFQKMRLSNSCVTSPNVHPWLH